MRYDSDKKIIESVIKEQKEKGINETKIYKEAYEFAITQLECNESQKIIKLNNQISDNIHGMAMAGKWSNLDNIAKHALTSCLSVIEENDDILSKQIKNIISFKLMILNMGKSEFIGLLTDKAKEEYFPNNSKGEVK